MRVAALKFLVGQGLLVQNNLQSRKLKNDRLGLSSGKASWGIGVALVSINSDVRANPDCGFVRPYKNHVFDRDAFRE